MSELDKHDKRFIFTELDKELKFSGYENSFLWLKDAGVALPVYNVDEPNIPLPSLKSSNLFRLFSSDTGLLTFFYPVETKVELIKKNGAHFENGVAEALTTSVLYRITARRKTSGNLIFL